MADTKGRLPLHWACRRPTKDKEDERALKILINCYTPSLIHRDQGGRTPLHYLLWYHAETRPVRLVEVFLQALPNSVGLHVPQGVAPTAAIIADTLHGCLPLTYAVMEGASKEVIKVLLQAYPSSKTMPDQEGRTALHWYLGAASDQHVSGEAPDPNAMPLWNHKRSSTMVGLLLNSKSARQCDATGRSPLHWAVRLLALQYYHDSSEEQQQQPVVSFKVIQSLLDHYTDALVLQDDEGYTPLHVLFQTVVQQQDAAWERLIRNKVIRDDVDFVKGGGGLDVPVGLVDLLLRQVSDDAQHTAAHVEDRQGRLPLHWCLATAPTSTEVVKLLIQAHPTSLVHTTEELETPLHCALSKPLTTPWQTPAIMQLLLQAYVTSRHGTFVNGKLALKMETSASQFPLHLACLHQACLHVTQLLFDEYPKAAKCVNGMGDLPLHCLVDETHWWDKDAESHYCRGATLALPMGWISETDPYLETRRQQFQVQQELVAMFVPGLDAACLQFASSTHGLVPLHICVALNAVDYETLYAMLDQCPESTVMKTTSNNYTALDFHEERQNDTNAKWFSIRELLFAFGPQLDNHRNKQDLLEQCAKVVRDEADGKGSVHATEFMAWLKRQLESESTLQLKETLSPVEAPRFDSSYKPKLGKRNKTVPPVKKIVSPSKAVATAKKKVPAKSIYDDDEFDHRYVVSPRTGTEDEDDDFLDDDDLVDQEYDPDDDPRYRDDDFDEDDEEEVQDESREETPALVETESESPVVKKEKFEEEKKEDDEEEKGEDEAIEAPFLSDVAMRLWTFFVIYQNPNDPSDNYSKTVAMILDKLAFPTVRELVSLMVPPYAQDYMPPDQVLHKTLEDAAQNACKAVIHKASYFVGKYDFRPSLQDSLVMHRSGNDRVVSVRAIEYIIKTEKLIHQEREEGEAEESIWATGEAPEPMHDKVESVFEVSKRKVCIKFIRSQQAYLREVGCRREMGVTVEGHDSSKNFVVPLINHFCAVGESEREDDKRFKFDLTDDRFQSIDLGGGETLNPHDFPFAVVLPFRDDGDLFEYFLHHGTLEMRQIREIGLQVGKALQIIHQKGLIHGNVSLSAIAMVTPADDADNTDPYWALTDLEGACSQSVSLMASIPSTGVANFMTATFPPELFVKLKPAEIKAYTSYWETVKTSYGINVDQSVVAPHVDPVTGDSYVLRCHFEPDTKDYADLPELPYKLVAAREYIDIWSFGRVMYILCTSGHPMFATNIKTGHLLAYDQVANFDHGRAREFIYKHVEDPLAQDLLFHLLSDDHQRSSLTMEKVLNHPFFSVDASDNKNREKVIRQIVAHRSQESISYIRSIQERRSKQAAGGWVSHRSKNLLCWSLDFSMRMYLTPSSLLRDGVVDPPDIPLSAVLLPYKLARNKSGKLTPSTKKDVEHAERMGILLLALLKACQFACRIESIVQKQQDDDRKWKSTDLLEAMDLSDNFQDLKTLMTQLAAAEVELFRDDPLIVARKIVQQCIVDLQKCVEGNGKAYLYLVDEHTGVPVLQSPFPFEVTQKLGQILVRTLPLMYTSVLYSCSVADSISGLVKLIFEAAYPHIPPTWSSSGVSHEMDKESMLQQVQMVRAVVAGLNESSNQAADDIGFLQAYLERCDPKNTYANLWKVTNGESAMWTLDVERIEALCKDFDIHRAFEMQKEQQRIIEEQERRIKQLEDALATAEFKRKHNLLDLDA
jgi:serine/threonine protein kinase/ankyrin repeat protein